MQQTGIPLLRTLPRVSRRTSPGPSSECKTVPSLEIIAVLLLCNRRATCERVIGGADCSAINGTGVCVVCHWAKLGDVCDTSCWRQGVQTGLVYGNFFSGTCVLSAALYYSGGSRPDPVNLSNMQVRGHRTLPSRRRPVPKLERVKFTLRL